MDEFKKKQYVSQLEVLTNKYKEVLWDIVNELPGDAFNQDYMLTIQIGKLKEANQDLLKVVKSL